MNKPQAAAILLLLSLGGLMTPLPDAQTGVWAQDDARPRTTRERRNREAEQDEDKKKEDEELESNYYNPLEIEERDPLIPQAVYEEERKLSQAEQEVVAAALYPLALEAAQTYDAGQGDAAFELWYRELRLRRYLGPLMEVEALGRVGEVAWTDSRTQDVRVIRERLQAIQKEATEDEEKSTLDRPLYTALGQAFARMRSRYDALAMYEFILTDVRASGDLQALEKTLNLIGELHKGWFDYLAAAKVYEELLDLAQSQGNPLGEQQYLEQLVYIYDESLQQEKAIPVKESLLGMYTALAAVFQARAAEEEATATVPPSGGGKKPTSGEEEEEEEKNPVKKIPPLQISLATDYLSLGEKDQAIANYEQAFNWAWDNKLYGYASDALGKLAELYTQYEQIDAALQLYQEQLKAAQFNYNVYEMMTIYDRMGELYLKMENQPQALQSFQEALRLAEAIHHQEEYFEEKISDLLNNFL